MTNRKNERGQGVVEFALVATLFVLLLAGLLDFGWAEGGIHVLSAATREAARVASLAPAATRTTAAYNRVQMLVRPYFAPGAVSVAVVNGAAPSGDPIVTVTATGDLPLLAGLIPLGRNVGGKRVLTIQRTVSFRDETKG